MAKASAGKKRAAAAALEAKRCSVCREKERRYHCPVDRAGYCSVGCFKIHKAEHCSQSALVSSRKAASFRQEEEQTEKLPGQDALPSTSLQEPSPPPPMRALSSLLWPPDPLEEGLNALDDPLNRDEPKPLFHNELMAIATSIPMRRLLSTHPHLKDLLIKLSKVPNAAPRFPLENRVRSILRLSESDGIPQHLSYRPGDGAVAEGDKDQYGNPRKHHGPGLGMDDHERTALREFNELVKTILSEERSKRSQIRH